MKYQEIVIFYNLFYNELYRSIICYYSLGATPLILLRLVAFAIIGYKLSEIISEARGVLKKEFYVRFSLVRFFTIVILLQYLLLIVSDAINGYIGILTDTC